MAAKKKEFALGNNLLEKVKRLTIVAMVADDKLVERLVLKGGNALDLIHGLSTRASTDIDFSMEDDFSLEELGLIRSILEDCLQATFRREGLEPFDVTLEQRPDAVTPDLAEFWGGYRVEFRLIESARFQELMGDYPKLQRSALILGERGKFQIDISRFEYCVGKEGRDFEGHRLFVYSPAMLAIEKLRAICQQMPEYARVVKRTRPGTARARDFLDIYAIIRQFAVDPKSSEFAALLKNIFHAKRVPLELLRGIQHYRAFHEEDFESVRQTIRPGIKLYDFEVYFDFVVGVCDDLKPLWEKKPPAS